MMEIYETLIETLTSLILHRDTPEGAFTCLVSFANIAQVRAMAKDVGAKEESLRQENIRHQANRASRKMSRTIGSSPWGE